MLEDLKITRENHWNHRIEVDGSPEEKIKEEVNSINLAPGIILPISDSYSFAIKN